MTTSTQRTVGALATQALATYLQRVERYEKSVIKDRDPEDLHQMRVNLRKLRTVMQVFAPGICLPKAGRESQVATITRDLGKLRDLDVILATLREQYLPDLPEKERTRLQIVLNSLLKKRKKLYKQTKSTLKGDRYQGLKKSLHQWTAHPKYQEIANLDIEITLPDLTLPLTSCLWLHPGWWINVNQSEGKFKLETSLKAAATDAVIADHSDTLHSLRKQIKRVRYQLRLVSRFYGDRLNEDVAKLAQLQEALGTLQDSLVMDDILCEILPDWQTQLPTLKALFIHSRHQAWKQWQKLQQYYLEPQNRKALRQQLIQPAWDDN
ncbi:MAG: CHAD domain-containing protein [Cyanobacteria bacterium P01_F01_bin.86]